MSEYGEEKTVKAILKELELLDMAKKSIEKSKKINVENIAADMLNYSLNEISRILKKNNLYELLSKEGLELLYKLN